MDEVIAALWRLQRLDQERTRRARERSLALESDRRAHIVAMLEENQERERQSTERLTRARTSLKQAELDLGTVESHLRQDETRLYSGEVTNPKELAQLEHRVGEERTQRVKLEERCIVLMEDAERWDHGLHEARAGANDAQGILREFDAEQERRAAEDVLAEAESAKSREGLLNSIPDRMREKYERLQFRYPGGALARVERGGSCGGCHNSLAQAEMERAERLPGVATCENCARLLLPKQTSQTGRG